MATIAELDIWRAANLLIRQHGPDAELEAAKRADLMLERAEHLRSLQVDKLAEFVRAH